MDLAKSKTLMPASASRTDLSGKVIAIDIWFSPLNYSEVQKSPGHHH